MKSKFNENKIHAHDKFSGLTIYTREATYSSNKHWGSFIYWEFVDFVSTFITAGVIIGLWEYVFRDLFINLITST